MILADDPMRRHRCPVTLFLSLAIADGVVQGIRSCGDIASLEIKDPTSWTILTYVDEALGTPVMRKAANKSGHMSSMALLPKVLHRMMQGQIERGRFGSMLEAIHVDNKRAAQREKKSKRATS